MDAYRKRKRATRRLFDKCIIGLPEECWPWKGAVGPDGYGRFYLDGKNTGTHRAAWTLTKGPIPEGRRVLHCCDNPPCCNPTHLFIGTNLDNIADRHAKNRDAKGEQNGNSKLSTEDIRNIRDLRDRGLTLRAIAGIYNVTHRTVLLVAARAIWRHV